MCPVMRKLVKQWKDNKLQIPWWPQKIPQSPHFPRCQCQDGQTSFFAGDPWPQFSAGNMVNFSFFTLVTPFKNYYSPVRRKITKCNLQSSTLRQSPDEPCPQRGWSGEWFPSQRSCWRAPAWTPWSVAGLRPLWTWDWNLTWGERKSCGSCGYVCVRKLSKVEKLGLSICSM